MPKASLWVCANCSHSTFDRSAKTHHARGTKRCRDPKIVKKTVTYVIPPLDDVLLSVKTIKQHMIESQVVVETDEFGTVFYETYGEQMYKSLFVVQDPIERAMALFDLTLSRKSGHPEFWNWVATGTGTIFTLWSNTVSSEKEVDEVNERLCINSLTYRMYKMFETAFRSRPAPGTESYNNETFWREKVMNSQVPEQKGSCCFYDQVHEYKPWMKTLRDHILADLPKRKEVMPIQRAEDTSPVVVVDTGPRTLTAWMCRGCTHSTTSKTNARTHTVKCPGATRVSGDPLLGLRVKYLDEEESIVGICEPTIPEDPILIRPAEDWLCNERKEVADVFVEEHKEKIKELLNPGFRGFPEVVKMLFKSLWGVDAPPHLQSAHVKRGKLHVYAYDFGNKSRRYIQYRPHGAILLGYVTECIYRYLGPISVSVRVLSQPCLDSKRTWDDVSITLFKDIPDLAKLGGPRFAAFCDELIALVPNRT